jgi:hypothetical protein
MFSPAAHKLRLRSSTRKLKPESSIANTETKAIITAIETETETIANTEPIPGDG